MLRHSIICNLERTTTGRHFQRHFSYSGREVIKPRMVHVGNNTAIPILNNLSKRSSSLSGMNVMRTKIYRRLASSTPAAGQKKEVSDLFFDNVGTLFLTAMGLVIAGLVRSSYNSSNRIAARDKLEKETELDPGEIHDLRLANGPDFNKQVMDDIIDHFLTQNGDLTSQKMTYTTFVSQVLQIMRNKYDPRFTIQLGHFLDRLALKLVQKQIQLNESSVITNNNEDQLDLDLLLTILSLALDSSIQDRVDVLFQIMTSSQQNNNNNASETNLLRMIDNLQKTCQLVSDAQILETKGEKYPTQQYHVASSDEMLSIAKESQKGKISSQALEQQKWDCHDFHVLLRSKAVCAWGECYHKTTLARKE